MNGVATHKKSERVSAFGRSSRAFLVMLVFSGVLLPWQARAATPEFEPVASFMSEGPIYLDEAARIIYHINWNISTGVTIKIIDLDSFAQRTQVRLPVPISGLGLNGHRGVGIHMQPGGLAAVDDQRHRLFYPFRDQSSGRLRMAVVDGNTGQYAHYPIPITIPSSDGVAGIESIAYSPKDDTLILLTVFPLPADANSSAGAFNLIALNASTGELKWSRALSECSSLFANEKMMPPLGVSGDHLYLSCIVGSNVPLITLYTAGTALVLKARITPTGLTEFETFASPILPRAGIFDPASGRMFVMNSKLLAAFDGPHEAWIGLAVPGNRPQLGINSSIGRVYMCGPLASSGLFFTDAARATYVPPPIASPKINCQGSNSWPIMADGRTGRVLVELPRADGVYWTALKDPVSPYIEPPSFNPDLGAEDVDEVPGLTQSSFSSQSGSYGTRIIWIGGPLGAIDNSVILVGDVLRGDIGYRSSIRFGEGSREVRLARVAAGKMSDQGVEGGAISADRDVRLESDLEMMRQHPINRGLRDQARPRGYNIPEQPSWRYSPAVCVGYGGDTDVASDESEDGLATVKCNYEDKTLNAEATAQKFELGGFLTIGESYASVKNYRDPKLGAVSESKAISKNINIAGLVYIAEATAISKAWAAGRPGKANTSYERTFKGVSIRRSDGSSVYQCTSVRECQLDEVIDAMNSALGPRIVARLPEPEQEFRGGTPAGTTSSLRQNEWEQLEEQVLYDKPVEDLTVAAFEIQIGANALSNSGYIVKFAGVTSSAGYRIFKLPQAVPLPPIDPSSLLAGNIGVVPSSTTQPPPPPPETFLKKIVQKVRNGMEWVFGIQDGYRSVAASWAMFLAPLYLLVRRRSMLRETIRVLSHSGT